MLVRALLWAMLIGVAAGRLALADCESARPILYLAISSDYHDAVEVTDFADRFARNHLRNLPGVADVSIFGDRRLVIRIRLDSARMAAYGIAPQDVEQALLRHNIEASPGGSEIQAIEYAVSGINPPAPGELGDIVVAETGAVPIRLQDVASIELGPGSQRAIVHYDGRDVVALGVINQPKAKLLEVYSAVNLALPALRALMPDGMHVEVTTPFSIVIERLSRE